MELSIPSVNNLEDNNLDNDKDLFIFLGVNGSGKSALMSYLARQADRHNIYFEMIRGYRAIEIEKEIIVPTFQSNDENIRQYIKKQNLEEISRYKDPVGREATGDVLWSIFSKESKFNQIFLDAIRRSEKAEDLGKSPFEEINKLFSSCGIKIKIELDDRGGIVNSKDGEQYAVRSLSDGERALLLLASQIITAHPNSYIFVDEPERHLHPSVTSKLLSNLLEIRSDCKFFIATHDPAILSAFSRLSSKTSIFMVHELIWKDGLPSLWDIKKLDSEKIPNEFANLLLGELTPVVFCEGESNSYDIRLYSTLFPAMQCISAHNSRGVISNVRAINDLRHSGIRTPKVWGILDRDWGQRQRKNHRELPDEVIHIKVHEVESAFFVPLLLDKVIERQISDDDSLEKIYNCFKKIFKGDETKKRFVKEYWLSQFGQISLSSYVDNFESENGKDGSIRIDYSIGKTIKEIGEEYDTLVENADIFNFVSVFTVKTTSFRSEFSKILGFTSFERYVNIALDIIKNDSMLREHIIIELGLDILLSEGK